MVIEHYNMLDHCCLCRHSAYIEANRRRPTVCAIMPSAACNVANAKAYASGCLVSTCNSGWRVSEDKSQCLGNKCSCLNGIASTGARCVIDGANICWSCDAGFKLSNTGDTCTGTLTEHCGSQQPPVACAGTVWYSNGVVRSCFSIIRHVKANGTH